MHPPSTPIRRAAAPRWIWAGLTLVGLACTSDNDSAGLPGRSPFPDAAVDALGAPFPFRVDQGVTDGDLSEAGADQDGGTWSCDLVEQTSNRGKPCTGIAEECGRHAECLLTEAGAEQGLCHQVCAPEICEEPCNPEESCASLTSSEGTPRVFPDGTPMGACLGQRTGDTAAYHACDGERICAPETDCLTFIEGELGFCFPRCGADADCATVDGAQPRCMLNTQAGTPPDHCGLLCTDLDAASDCPDGYACRPAGGVAMCVREGA